MDVLAEATRAVALRRNDSMRRLYQQRSVPLYWIVDADAGAVECWTSDGRFLLIERGQITWHPDGASAPFVLALAELFRSV